MYYTGWKKEMEEENCQSPRKGRRGVTKDEEIGRKNMKKGKNFFKKLLTIREKESTI
jgi:hypothetical protein